MAQKKKKYTKHQIAMKVGIKPYMMAAWEQQFDITPLIKNGEAVYSRKHLAQFKEIRELLYEKGFSMDAAKKYLQDKPDLEGTILLATSPLSFDTQRQEALKELIGVSPAEQSSQESSAQQTEELHAKEQQLEEQRAHEKEITTKLLSIKEQLVKLSNTL